MVVVAENTLFTKECADGARDHAKKLGIQVLGFEAWDGKASSYEALASKIKESGAESVYLGGIVCNNGGKLIEDLRAGLGAGVTLVAPDGFTPFSAVVDGAGSAAEGLWVSIAGLPNEKLGSVGRKFLTDFKAFQGKTADPYAVYAGQAAVVLLDAIARSNGTRPSVTSELFKTKVTNGIFGSFNIDRNGDTTLKGITIYKIVNGSGHFNRLITP